MAARCARGARDARRPDDRVRAGGRGEHGLVRPVARDRRDRARDGRVAPRRRRVRAVGGREPAPGVTSSQGVERADSWATDGHKWLNVPYDCGLAFCAQPDAHRASMTMQASYFEGQGSGSATRSTGRRSRRAARARSPSTPPALARARRRRRARRALLPARRAVRGAGLERLPGCELAERGRLEPGALPLRGRRADERRARARAGGRRGLDGRNDLGRPTAIRISVSNWRTTEADIDRTVAAFEAALVTV